ncbi:MAG TPA: 1-(5-phosphoribosyl)-5-[(5-phosphoribosylamino)methylideneamino]imidazole-4-carboxamide isomerase [Spirochaetota bacterium]|nr:1-(5-phosphoribosyl)-5-[(5-phosphoribosylamino)methylideneamino]imidazole-4-carboxamide isomerase [Spirochaetota bacterium]HPC41846.1 1-(5-phosphoribosyl)-5-[(5-phosphoribosylamino)methylideneamino]imidazole-4-carboxamide isomerase [Spirochaetota bacterium]HPL19020.1 1-(5-phosphoribosyl)-5-[(5-phosphoribosylamino)methylideneamino]imidazole-4-carboxamide isomerase [Spirochaetota bacterium]HQF07567.1 1-(5-phosphoribosyl)-5-[(5-phosphoribosylamino)methylideneamino]imidazole-4-carboxamide isomera
MLIIPAIDIKNGNCVRLLQGDPDRETVYSSSPVDVAKRFEEAGAQLIHVVDLDGAFEGKPVNHAIVSAVASSVSIPIEIGGGIRTAEAVTMYADMGIRRIIVGTVILEESFKSMIGKFPDMLVAGIDAKNSLVATHGWKKASSMKAMDLIGEIAGCGISEIIYTDIATDGMMTGPNLVAIGEILENIKNISLIASGGISSLRDIEALSRFEGSGLKGCITGKAVYDGRINLHEAIARFM